MNLDPRFFTNFWLILGFVVYLWVMFRAIRAAQWWRLRNLADLNVLLYAILGVALIWHMNTDFKDSQDLVGPTLHLLGATLLTMMFGWAFAIVAMSIILLAFILVTASSASEALLSFPWNALTSGVLPVLVSYQLFRIIDRHLPNNFFVYIFVCTFFGAALAMASVILVTAGIHYLSGAYTLEKLSYGYIPFGLVLMLPEAFITGMLMSIFVIYQPNWVSTFDDHRYLHKQ